MRGFRSGLCHRSPLILLIAAVLLVPALLAVQAFFTSGAWTTVPVGYWLRNRTDSFTYASWVVGDMRRRQPDGPAVYLLGGSAAREAVVSGESLAAEIESLGGPTAEVYDLGFMNQNFAESLAIADNVPAGDAWVLVGVNLNRFTATRETNARQAQGRDLLVASGAVRRFAAERWQLEEWSYTILPGIFAYAVDLAKRNGGYALHGKLRPRTYRQHHYTVSKIWSRRHKRELVDFWNTKNYPEFRAGLQPNLDLLEEILRRCRERRLHAVVVELPLNGEIVGDAFDEAIRQYREPTQKLARAYGAEYLDFNDELDIPSAHFRDLSHLVEPGRVVWQHALAEALAQLMRNDGSEGGSG